MDAQKVVELGRRQTEPGNWSAYDDRRNWMIALVDALEALNRENKELTEGMTTETDEVIFGDEDEAPLLAARRFLGPWVPIPPSDPEYWEPSS